MTDKTPQTITVQTIVNAPAEKVWQFWTDPAHIIQWNSASDDWHTPRATNDLKVGGRFSCTMAARDGSMSFDFGGTYTTVKPHSTIEYTLDDDRKVSVTFSVSAARTAIVETFEAEGTHSIDQQRSGWQAILNNFKKHVEAN